MLLDTNIVIYACKPEGQQLAALTSHPNAAVASVIWIESLGYKSIQPEEELAIRGVLSAIMTYPLDEEIIQRAIQLRQQKSMKLGDAIIAATALEYAVPLVTRNEGDFKHIAELQIINPFAEDSAA
ncbi:type II toxin-antitoxin system VapC family toxin [Prosthecobacter sp.]|jgi:predicted nucleic acid-binding protein